MEKSFYDIIEFRHDSDQPQFKFEELEGAPEVTFKGIFVASIGDKEMKPLEDKEITIDLKGYVFNSLDNQELFTINHENEALMKDISFNSISDLTSIENKKLYLYQDFECKIKRGEKEVRSFEFSLKNFGEHPSYDIFIDKDFNVMIKDQLFEEKKKYFWWCQNN